MWTLIFKHFVFYASIFRTCFPSRGHGSTAVNKKKLSLTLFLILENIHIFERGHTQKKPQLIPGIPARR